MTHDDDEPEWDYVPSADPQIQKEYEGALGEFLVRFNRIESIVSDVIVQALDKAKRKDILKPSDLDGFARKVLVLALVSLRFPDAASHALISELRDLGKHRNDLAHGHFDQNPFDGSYDVVTSRKRVELPVEKIRSLTERTERVYEQLRVSEAHFDFYDVTLEDTILPTD